jgi:response regulator RpfG family c-di-GMP phosphodiesterase
MKFAPLASVRHRVALGQRLPFNVYAADGSLLLARGLTVDSEEHLSALIDRGVRVNLDEVLDPVEIARRAPAELLPKLWQDVRDKMVAVMRKHEDGDLQTRLQRATVTLETLVRRDPDVAVFHLLSDHPNDRRELGLRHAAHSAVIATLIAHRLNWSGDDIERATKGALTMNMSMLELLGELARKRAVADAVHRDEIRNHPIRSRQMLEAAGITDSVWLGAVEQHHEQSDGSGYPAGMREVSELASLLRCADAFASGVDDLGSDERPTVNQMIRKIYIDERANVYATALVKELGVYPPGCSVTLANGEIALVVRRGATIKTPLVAAIANRFRRPFNTPVRRDTSRPGFRVVSALPACDFVPTRAQALMALQAT